ncbi:MAG: hypothetical protein QNL04_10965 [SAR324 cluster bacterium]|nr:hypothetical protein [SAR324 cluster bacterium]
MKGKLKNTPPKIISGSLNRENLFNIIFSGHVMSAIDMDVDPVEQEVIERFLVYHYNPEWGDIADFRREMDKLIEGFFNAKDENGVTHEFIIEDIVRKLDSTEKVALAGLLIMVMDADGEQAIEELELMQYFLGQINKDAGTSFEIVGLEELSELKLEDWKVAVANQVTEYFNDL